MTPFTLALIGSTATSAIGGLMGKRASDQAAGAQSQAAMQSALLQAQAKQQAVQAQREAQTQAVGALKKGVQAYDPYQQFGAQATNRYATLMGLRPGEGSGSLMEMPTMAQLQMDPSYKFQFDQGMKALNQSMAARGLGVSGSAIRGAQEFGQGLASTNYGAAYNRFMQNRNNQIAMLQGGVGTGINAAQGIGGLQRDAANVYTGTGTNVANTLLANPYGQGLENAAAARASGYMGGATALQSALQAPARNYMLYSLINKFAPADKNAGMNYGPQQGYNPEGTFFGNLFGY